jgi:hypothetical protein
VLGAPLTVEGVTTVEATETPVMGRLLTASSCIDGERMVRGGSRLRSKTRWCGDARKQRRDGLTGGGAGRAQTAKMAAFRHARSGGAPTVRRQRGLDNGEALSERHYRPAPLWRCAGVWQPRGNGVLTGGPDAERERLTSGTPWQ